MREVQSQQDEAEDVSREVEEKHDGSEFRGDIPKLLGLVKALNTL